MVAMTVTVSAKITGRLTHMGRARRPNSPSSWRSPANAVTDTGNASMKMTRAASATGATGNRSRPGGAAQEADPDPEEAGQQDEVGQVDQVHIVGRRPADQGQLDQQHQGAGEQQPPPVRQLRAQPHHPLTHLGHLPPPPEHRPPALQRKAPPATATRHGD
jgi:hypothetical protein